MHAIFLKTIWLSMYSDKLKHLLILLVVSVYSSIYCQGDIPQKTSFGKAAGNDATLQPTGEPSFVKVTDARGYKALVLVPSNTSEVVNGKYPAILFLHGIGESGNNLDILKQNGFPRVLEGDQQFPFIFIMPQCPSSTEWYYTNADNITAMRLFLDDILNRFPVDPARLYITGLSMGGIGSWYFAINMPSRFAALVPVAFRGDGWSPAPAKDIPVWAFHGNKDSVIPISKAQELVDQFRAAGGSVRFEPYPNGSHDGSTWTVTYNNLDLYDWMLRKKKTVTSIDNFGTSMPHNYLLGQNFPNPFNPATTIKFELPEASDVSLKIFDLLGREVETLVNKELSAGFYNYQFNAATLASGIYFYRLTATSFNGDSKQYFNEVKKLTLLK
jgi:poly(3-hydroxybutyrate) depolymerase